MAGIAGNALLASTGIPLIVILLAGYPLELRASNRLLRFWIRPGSCGNKNGVTFFYPKEKLAWKEREGGLALLRFKGIPRGYIVLSTHVRENSRRRFTLAHEVGHYVLPDQQELCQPCTKMQIESWEDDLSKPEIAANRFSAEILMPRSLVRLEDMPTFESIKELARACDTSLTASASRLAELSSFRVAAVWSQGGRVRWYKGSEEFYRWVRKGPLDPASFAYDAFQGLSVPNSLESVPASAWLFNKGLLEDARILEHSRYLPTYNAVLSWLAVRSELKTGTRQKKIRSSRSSR